MWKWNEAIISHSLSCFVLWIFNFSTTIRAHRLLWKTIAQTHPICAFFRFVQSVLAFLKRISACWIRYGKRVGNFWKTDGVAFRLKSYTLYNFIKILSWLKLTFQIHENEIRRNWSEVRIWHFLLKKKNNFI